MLPTLFHELAFSGLWPEHQDRVLSCEYVVHKNCSVPWLFCAVELIVMNLETLIIHRQ